MKKEFNAKLYAVAVFFIVASLLATTAVVTYKSRYNGFSAEKTATVFVQSIVETGDGYNAYKNTVVSKNYKYGDFIRVNYMYPIIYSLSGYIPNDDIKKLKGYNDNSFKGEKTTTDDGTLSGEVIAKMYDYYVSLTEKYGSWDNYDEFFTEYFRELYRVRQEIFGDKYITDEIMFTALEANVASYGEHLTGTEDEYDTNTGIQTSVKTTGLYEKAFGENYKFVYETINIKSMDDISYYTESETSTLLEQYKISADEITEVKTVTIAVKVNGNTVATQELNVVKINSTWYVDNTSADTSALYKIA